MAETPRYHHHSNPLPEGNTNSMNNAHQPTSSTNHDAESWLTTFEYECYTTLSGLSSRTEDEERRFNCLLHKINNRKNGGPLGHHACC